MGNQLVKSPEAAQARRRVASSNAYGLVETSAPDEEILRSLTHPDRQAVPLAIAVVRAALAAPDEQQQDELVIALGRQIGLMRPNLAVEQKQEWIELVLLDLVAEPASLILDALPQVRRSCKFEGEIVPSIIELVDRPAARLRHELRILEKLEHLIA